VWSTGEVEIQRSIGVEEQRSKDRLRLLLVAVALVVPRAQR
jgi:hypothetical protein